MSEVKCYRCKHHVEAVRWIDTDENREAFYDWFDKHDATFCTIGSVVQLPDGGDVAEGEWILIDQDGDIMAVSSDDFHRDYEECHPDYTEPRIARGDA